MINTRPKILFVGPIPPPFSGPELGLQQFLESIELNGAFSIRFLKTNFRRNNRKKGKFGALMILNFFKFFFKLIWLLIKERPKCVYYPITPTQIGWIGRDSWTIILSKLFGSKIIIHLRGSHFKLNYNRFHPIIKYLTAFSLKRVNMAIVQAEYLRNQFSPFIKDQNIEVLYQAMDISEYCTDDKSKTIKGKILVIGHMTKAKGYTDILKIIPKICKQFPHAQFCFAGDMRTGERGVFYNQLTGDKIQYEDPFEAEKQILNSKYKDNYVNLGVINGDHKLMHLRTSEVFLSASYSEGFSRSLLEAMAVGKPVAYTPVGAHREVFKEGVHGCVFEPGNLMQIEKTLTHMLTDSDKLLEMGMRNSEYVKRKFSLEIISNDFKNIILNTLAK